MDDNTLTTDEDADIRSARNMLEYLDEQVKRGKEIGIDFTEVENMLSGASIMIESGETTDVLGIINQCMQLASNRFSEYRLIIIAIQKAEKEIQAAHTSGEDVSESGKLLKMARAHMEKGDYHLGIETAKWAVNELRQKQSADVVWGSAVTDS